MLSLMRATLTRSFNGNRQIPPLGSFSRPCRAFSSDGNSSSKGPDDGEVDELDEFGFSFAPDEQEDEAALKLEQLSSVPEDITPELASELVSRMVAATKKGAIGADDAGKVILDALTPHTISVLRASRVVTNDVFAPGADVDSYPIIKKVTAVVNVPKLNLSAPANAALKALAGSRCKDEFVKIGCNKFGTSAENQAYAISKLDLLVRRAKEAVADPVDLRRLETWKDVEEEVQCQLKNDDLNSDEINFLLSRDNNITEQKQ